MKIAKQWLIVLVMLGAATLARWLLTPILGSLYPYYTYIVAIVFVAWLVEWFPALVMLIISYGVAERLFILPHETSSLKATHPLFAAAIYLFTGLSVIFIVQRMHAARHLLEQKVLEARQREQAFQREVERRQEAEEELRMRERQLSMLVENSPDVVGRLDRDLRHIYISARIFEITGFLPEHFIGKTALEVGFAESLWLPFEESCRRAFDTGEPVCHEFSLETPFGERHFECRLIPERKADGDIASLLFITTDTTERRRMQTALLQSEASLRLAVESADAGVLEWSIENQTMTWSARLFRILGYEPGSIEPRYEHWQARVHPDDWPEVDAKRQNAVNERRDCRLEYRLLLPDGSIRWVRMTGRYRWTADDSPAWASAMFLDITQAKEAEAALVRSEREFRALFDRSGIAQAQGDVMTRKLLRVNRRFCEITGYDEDELKGMNFLMLTHPDDRAENEQKWRRLLRGDDDELIMDKRYIRKDGSIIWVHVTSILVRDESGAPLHTATAIQDITQSKRAEEESRSLNVQLAEADRRKDVFLATLAHELRNPLAPIRNALELLKRSPDDPRLLQMSNVMMERQVRQMVRLIDDLLDLSRITQDKLHLHREKIDLATVARHAIESCMPVVEQHGHELAVTLPSETIWLDADPVRLAQVLCNLITNASKYSEKGSRIEIVAEKEFDDILIRIRDKGIGIPAHMLSSVFEMFTQLDQSLERSQGGLGIGLALAKRLILMHGGSISAHSAGLGEGSEFIVRLPIRMESNHQDDTMNMNPTDNSRSSIANLRILVVDDNRDAAESLCMLLELNRNEVYVAHDGHEAFEAAERYKPDVILLDIGLPKMNGHDVARRIREQPWGRHIILIALTGWGHEEDRRQTSEAGFNHHLVKPVDPSLLMTLLASHLKS